MVHNLHHLQHLWQCGHRTTPSPPRKDTRMIAVSFTLILALLVGYALTGLPTVEVEK